MLIDQQRACRAGGGIVWETKKLGGGRRQDWACVSQEEYDRILQSQVYQNMRQF